MAVRVIFAGRTANVRNGVFVCNVDGDVDENKAAASRQLRRTFVQVPVAFHDCPNLHLLSHRYVRVVCVAPGHVLPESRYGLFPLFIGCDSNSIPQRMM